MNTGTHFDTHFSNELDADGELGLTLGSTNSADWLNKEMAVDVIKHLSTAFSLDVILEAIEKHEESNRG